MILGFAQFQERSRKLKKTFIKQSRKGNGKNNKKRQKKETKWSRIAWKIHSKNEAFFKGPKKLVFAAPGLVPDASKSPYWFFRVVLDAPSDFRGSPKSSQNRPSDAKSHEKRKPRASKNAPQNQLVFRTSFLMISHAFLVASWLHFSCIFMIFA